MKPLGVADDQNLFTVDVDRVNEFVFHGMSSPQNFARSD